MQCWLELYCWYARFYFRQPKCNDIALVVTGSISYSFPCMGQPVLGIWVAVMLLNQWEIHFPPNFIFFRCSPYLPTSSFKKIEATTTEHVTPHKVLFLPWNGML